MGKKGKKVTWNWRGEFPPVELSDKELRDLYEWILDQSDMMFTTEAGPGVELSEEIVKELDKKAAALGVSTENLVGLAQLAWYETDEE